MSVQLKNNYEFIEGEPVYRPAFDAFAEMGLHHRIWVNDSHNKIEIANNRVLQDAILSICKVTEAFKRKVLKILEQHACISIAELRRMLKIKDITPLLIMISKKEIFMDLKRDLITQPESAIVSSSMTILKLSREIRNDQSTFFNPYSEEVDETKLPTAKQIERVLIILKRLDEGENSRSTRRWRKLIREGKHKGLTRFQALLPAFRNCGSKGIRLNPKIVEYAETCIDEYLAVEERPTQKSAYRVYKSEAKKELAGHKPVSIKTFRKLIRLMDRVKYARDRGGKRAANAAMPPSDVKDREVKATAAFEMAAIDHYKADIFCKIQISEKEYITERPWITIMVDVFTGAILAVWIGFRDPSRRACAMVIRQCVKKYGKLPSRIITDKGKDFVSVYFHALLARYGVSLSLRPTGHGRFGSEVERVFGVFKSIWLDIRPGNITDHFEKRSVSMSHSAEKFAELSLEDLLTELHQVVEWYNNRLHGASMNTPKYIEERSMEMYSCIGRDVKDDYEFMVSTAVDVKDHVVDPSRGVHIDDLHYWSPRLLDIGKMKKKVKVRIEPEDPFVIYAEVDGQWITCHASGSPQFITQDPVERMATALKVLDLRSARRQAIEDEDVKFVGNLIEQDKVKKLDIKGDASNSDVIEAEAVSDLFSNIVPESFETQKWG